MRALVTRATHPRPRPGPGPGPASPGLPLDLGEVAYTDCHEDAGVEVPCHLEAGVIGLWSAVGWGAKEKGMGPGRPRRSSVFGAATECPVQVLGTGEVVSHPHRPPHRRISVASRGAEMGGTSPPTRSPELALLSGGRECQQQQANVDEDLIGFRADLGAGTPGTAVEVTPRTERPWAHPVPSPGPPPG